MSNNPEEISVSDGQEGLRNRLWDETWQLRYHALFGEKAAETMLNFWLVTDHFTRLLIAFFASTSALAGWSMWSSDTGKVAWGFLAGIAALLSIFSSTMGVQDRVKRFTEAHASFVRLRLRIDCLLTKMRINPDFDANLVHEDFVQFQEQYVEACPTWPHDIFFFKRLQNGVQDAVDESMMPNHGRQTDPSADPSASTSTPST